MKLYLPICLMILVALSQCNGLRILGIFPLHGKSHWTMGESLLTSLAKRGHKVDVVTHFTVKNPPPNYRERSLSGTLEPVLNNMNASYIRRFNGQDVKHLVELAGNRICDLLAHPELDDLIKNPPKYDVVIVEIFVASCYLAFGRHLKVPVVGVITCSFPDWLRDATGNLHNPSFIPSLFSPYEQRMTFSERLMNTFLTNVITYRMNYYLAEQDVYVKKYFNMDTTIAELHKNVAAILVNSHHSVNGIVPTPIGTIEVGGLHVTEQAEPLSPEVQKWLDESTDGCIYFSFGSMVRIETFPEPVLKTFYKVFESIAPVRVLMKIAKKEELLPGYPKNVMIQSWFSQVSVFKHKNTKAFITHGGLLGTQEAIYFGIPMVGIPLFGDQNTNLRNVASKKIAVNLGSIDNVTEETLSAAVNAILHDETYRTNMKKLSTLFRDRPMSAIDTAMYWVEYVAKHGNVLQSPSVHLPWWQLYLVDVYAFLLACLAAALYAVVYAYRKVKNGLSACKDCSSKHRKNVQSKKKN